MLNDIAEVLVTEEAIKAKVAELGRRISEDYRGKNLLLVGLLRGAIVFLSDLMRAIAVPIQPRLYRHFQLWRLHRAVRCGW